MNDVGLKNINSIGVTQQPFNPWFNCLHRQANVKLSIVCNIVLKKLVLCGRTA